jgi:hypothetical protein
VGTIQLTRSQHVNELVCAHQATIDVSSMIIDLAYPSGSIRRLVSLVYTGYSMPHNLSLSQYVDLVHMCAQLLMTEAEEIMRMIIIYHADRPVIHVTGDDVWKLLVYASQQNLQDLARAAIKTAETVDTYLVAPKLEQLDSIPSRYMNALLRSVIRLGLSAPWSEIANDMEVVDSAESDASDSEYSSFAEEVMSPERIPSMKRPVPTSSLSPRSKTKRGPRSSGTR